MTVPELEPHCGSWICTQNDPDAVHAVREVYERETAEKLAARGWRVLTAAQYLVEFNRGVKLAAAMECCSNLEESDNEY